MFTIYYNQCMWRSLSFCVLSSGFAIKCQECSSSTSMEDCKKNEKKWIVEGALIGVFKSSFAYKGLTGKKKCSQKAVPLKLPVMLSKHWRYAKKLKGQHANGIAAIQMAAIAVQCLWSAPSYWLYAPWFPRCAISEGKRRLNLDL